MNNDLSTAIGNMHCNMTIEGDILCLANNNINYNSTNNNINCKNLTISDTIVTTIAFYENIDIHIIVNHVNYAKQHNYDYFILRHELNDKYLNSDRDTKNTTVNLSSKQSRISFTSSQQRVTLLYKLFFDENFIGTIGNNVEKCQWKSTSKIYNYEKILWIDFDAIFLNDSISINNIINYSINKYIYYNYIMKNNKNYNLSLIITGDSSYKINAGVMILLKTNFTKFLLQSWDKFMKLAAMNDQIALAILLFGGDEKILKFLSSDSKSQSKQLQLIENLNRMKQGKSSFQDSVLSENFGGVTQLQATYSHNVLLPDKFGNNIAFVEQRLMNSNIWNQFNNIDNVLKQWVIHFAGQGYDIKSQMILKFLHYKQEYYTTQLQNKNEMRQAQRILKMFVENYCLKTARNVHIFEYAQKYGVSFEKAIQMLDKRNYTMYNITI